MSDDRELTRACRALSQATTSVYEALTVALYRHPTETDDSEREQRTAERLRHGLENAVLGSLHGRDSSDRARRISRIMRGEAAKCRLIDEEALGKQFDAFAEHAERAVDE